MHDEDSPILNTIAKGIVEKGGIVDVYRVGRGVLGPFISIAQARGSPKWDPITNKPLPKVIVPEFWTVHYGPGHCEMLIKSAFENLEVRKVQPNVYHVIIPA